MSSDTSEQVAQRDQRTAQRAARRPTLQQEAEPSTHPSTPQDIQASPPIPPRAPSRTQTPSQSPDTTRTVLPYVPSYVPGSFRTPGRPPLPSPPIPSTQRAMSDYDRKEVSTKLNTKNLEFSGRKADFRAWKDVIKLYMIGNPSQFPDDERKIAFMLSWMCGSKDVKIWASNQQRQLQRATDWGTWDTFEKILEDSFGDPAAETQAREFLITYKQKDTKARPYFATLELWFNLANITDDTEKYNHVKRTMNPNICSSLLLVGIPTTYTAIKDKMIMLDDEEDKVRSFNLKSLDSRLGDSSTTGPQQYTPASQAYRVQGHTPAPARQQCRPTIKEILAMPPGTHPRPPRPCYNCEKLNHNPWHWNDECPNQWDQPPRFPQAPQQQQQRPRNTNYQRAPNSGQNRAQAPPQQEQWRPLPPFGPGPRGPRPQRFNRQIEQSGSNTIASANALLNLLSLEDKRAFLVDQAKALGL